MTKSYLGPDMKSLSKEHKKLGVKINTYFDDTVFLAKGSTGQVYNLLLDTMVDFKKIVAKLHLRMSTKGVVVTSDPNLTSKIIAELAHMGERIGSDGLTRDVGVNFHSWQKYKKIQTYTTIKI